MLWQCRKEINLAKPRSPLQLGDGGTSGSLAGNIANAGILAFDRADAMTLHGILSGTGQINQLGTGTTTLTADSLAFSGQP